MVVKANDEPLSLPPSLANIDDLGTLTFEELHRRTNALARALANDGVGPQDNVAVMARNHRYFIEATVALSKLGANTLYLNTAFAGPQIAEVVRQEGATALIYDAEFESLVSEARQRRRHYLAWADGQPGRYELCDGTVYAMSPEGVITATPP